MKIRASSALQGSTLVGVLVITGLLMVSLAGYLQLTVYQSRSAQRGESWNMAIALAEAGVEEGFAHLWQNSASNFTANGWAIGSNGFTKQRTFTDSNYFAVTLLTNYPLQISAVGYVQLPGQTNYVSRIVDVEVQELTLHAKALLTSQSVTLTGQRLDVDSFDSAEGPYSALIRHDVGDIACVSRDPGCISIGNGEVYGRVTTGPGGSISMGPSGSVGSLAWHDDGSTGIEPNWSRDDLNITIPNAPSAPVGYANTPMPAGALPTGQFTVASLIMNGNQNLQVAGHAELRVTSTISLTGNAYIQILTNASLIIYMEGTSANFGGNGILNDSTNANNFHYFGSPNNTSLSMAGNATFAGVVNAPQAALSMGGGGNNNYDFFGSCIVKSAYLNGHFSFHYDEQLTNNFRIGWAISKWNERY